MADKRILGGGNAKTILRETNLDINAIPEKLQFSEDGKRPMERVASAVILVTQKCQKDCPNCFINPKHRDEGFLAVVNNGGDLKFDERIVASITSGFHKNLSVALSGGEFFLHPEYERLLWVIANSEKKPRFIEVDTNMEVFTDTDEAKKRIFSVKNAVGGSGVRLCIAASIDDNHAYGTLEEGGRIGLWDDLAKKATRLRNSTR
ncbi:Uncharacterised protein [uncultured archaeon]|nr:Uncharacterised protein [uncultured archaeon]